MRIFYKDEVSLEKFTTTRLDKKKNISKMPTDVSEVLNPILNEFEKLTDKIGVDDFILKKVIGRGTFGKVIINLFSPIRKTTHIYI